MYAIAPEDHDSLVIVPTYNEVQNLECLVQAVLDQDSTTPFTLLIIDDNSPDGTGELADLLAAERPERLAVLHRARKLGLGTAYIAGFRYALQHGYTHVFEMDVDFSHDPSTLPLLRSALEDADLVVGSRYVRGGSARGWSIPRRALSQLGSFYAGSILGVPVRDLTGGFKGYRANVLANINLGAIKSSGYAFQIEMTYYAFAHGFRIVELPICFGPRAAGNSKMGFSIVLEALLAVWRLRLTAHP